MKYLAIWVLISVTVINLAVTVFFFTINIFLGFLGIIQMVACMWSLTDHVVNYDFLPEEDQ